MPLGPEDVIRKSFTMSRFKQGYDPAEVDSFLEEVVAELRRRDLDREELLVQLQNRSHQTSTDDRLEREQDQLDLIRRERADLVAELRSLNEQVELRRSSLSPGTCNGGQPDGRAP